jgi:hypothetical protein
MRPGGRFRERTPRAWRSAAVALAASALALVLAGPATAHIERASYWPDPAPDNAEGVPTGGAVPEARSLFSALQKSKTSETRVVCTQLPSKKADPSQNPSIVRLTASLTDAVQNGYRLRPSEPPVPVTQAEADQLRNFNLQLLAKCRYTSIQSAVNDSGNNDRVVVMPGIYTEPKSRAAPTNDPKCDQWEEVNDRPGDGEGGFQTGANTYTYIFHCPNDQNLIAVLGREPNHDALPPTPRDDRRGIPDLGPCIRCNLQLEGSGVSPDDVVVDAGRVESGNGGPADPVKDVGIRADRADGFVLANMTVRHVAEHAIYPHEVDGYRLQRFKTFHAEEYGTLQFASDHGLVQDCETAGSGDAGIYPGSAPDTGEEVTPPDVQRLNTEIRRCDMHHNALGYSGTAANAVHIHHNDFYDNAQGFSTDVFTAAGHPGFPQDSDLIEHNEFYSNNFNPYLEPCPPGEEPGPPATATCSDVVPTVPVPVGTGMWIAGGNNNEVRDNTFWDNWRRGAMVFSVPDTFVCGPQTGNSQHGCDPVEVNTSFRNELHDNVMGRTPAGVVDPNGLDFWWDQFPGNANNCWYSNVGKNGDRASLTADPPINPAGDDAPSGGVFLPGNCETLASTGAGGDNETELVSCLANFEEGAPTPCTWFETPTEPQP